MPTSNDIHASVTKVLVQALGVEQDDITPSASLQRDLGAESIDFLDIVFRLEREFMIKIRQGELFPEPVFQRGTEIVRGGQVTDEGLAALRATALR
jgi:acyl carrier protein